MNIQECCKHCPVLVYDYMYRLTSSFSNTIVGGLDTLSIIKLCHDAVHYHYANNLVAIEKLNTKQVKGKISKERELARKQKWNFYNDHFRLSKILTENHVYKVCVYSIIFSLHCYKENGAYSFIKVWY